MSKQYRIDKFKMLVLLNENGLSPQDLAGKVGLSKSAIYRLLKSSDPSLQNVTAIASFFNREYSDLLTSDPARWY